MQGRIQYQIITEPVPVSQTPSVASWHGQISQPTLRNGPSAAVVSPAIAYANFTPAVENVTVDKYYQWLTEPVRRGGLSTASVASGLTEVLGPVSGPGNVAYAITNSIVPYSQTLLYQSIADPVPTAINTVDKWFVQLAVPQKRLGYPAYEQASTSFVGSDTARDNRWFSPLSEPTRRKPTIQPDAPFVGSDTAKDARWFAPLSEPTRRRTTQQPDGPSLVYVPAGETVTLDKWFTPLADAPRRKATIQPDALSFIWLITGTNNVAFASTNIIVPYVRTVLYQSLADPVPITATAEIVTLDKWFSPLAIAPARKPTVQRDAASFVGSDTARDARWFSPLSEPTRRKTTILQADALSFVGSDTARDARWFAPLSEPTRRKPTVPPDGLSFVSTASIPETVSIDKWQQPLSDPTRRKAATQPDALSFIWSDTARDTLWFAPLSEPRRRTATVQPDGLSFVYAPAEVITIDKWQQPLADAQRRRPTIQPDGLSLVYPVAAETITVDKWLVPLADAPRRKPTVQPDALSFGYAPGIETVTVDKWIVPLAGAPARKATTQPDSLYFVGSDTSRDARWFTPLSEPTRRKPTVQPDGLSLTQAAPFEIIGIDRWQQPLSEPVRPRGTITAQQQALSFVGSDTATDSRWFAPLSEPVRRKPIAEYPALSWSYFTPASTEVVTVDKYYNWLSEPVRSRRAAEYPALSFANFTPAPEVVTLDKYYQWLAEPVRARRVVEHPAFSFLNFAAAEVVTVDKYYNWLSEPVRYRLGLPVYDQQSLALVQFQNDVNPGFIAPLSQPTYRKSDISARPMFFEPPSELARPDKWFSPLALPTRLRTTPTAAQPYLFFVKAEPFAEAVSADRWQQPLSEPMRSRGLKAFQIVGFSYVAPVQVAVSTTPFIMRPFP